MFGVSGFESVVELEEFVFGVIVGSGRRCHETEMVGSGLGIGSQSELLEVEGRFGEGVEQIGDGKEVAGFLEESGDGEDEHFLDEELVVEGEVEGSEELEESGVEHEQVLADF